MMLAFDIETESLPEEQVRLFSEPFKKPAHPGPFDPSAVRTGNLKDQIKIDAKIQEARDAHALAVQSYEADCTKAEREYWQGLMDKAALSPVTGRVVVVGLRSVSGKETLISGDEPDILSSFWNQYRDCSRARRQMIGANILNFDLPFLVRRSWINRVEVPDGVRDGRYWDKIFVDIREHWLCGQWKGDVESSLDLMARALGVGHKLDKTIGAHFGKLWRGDQQEHELAKRYLQRDLELTIEIARRLGIIF
jgi:hypothetical protein